MGVHPDQATQVFTSARIRIRSRGWTASGMTAELHPPLAVCNQHTTPATMTDHQEALELYVRDWPPQPSHQAHLQDHLPTAASPTTIPLFPNYKKAHRREQHRTALRDPIHAKRR
jgi:hypothetical protein